MRLLVLLLAVLSPIYSIGQNSSGENNCKLSISGNVIDEHNQETLGYATIYINEIAKGVSADSNGYYKITNLCPGTYTLICRHIGCEPIYDTVTITHSFTLNFYPEHHAEELQATFITHINHAPIDAQEDRTDIPIQNKLKSNPVVSLVQTGSRISKPVVWGLYGNRLAIIQDGIPINDQQWGQDHAPAADNNTRSFSLNYTPLAYSSETSAGMIQISSRKAAFKNKSFLLGDISSFYSTNGKNYGSSFFVATNIDSLNRLVASFYGEYSKGGDLSAPNYYLTNTGGNNLTLSSIITYRANKDAKWEYEIGLKNISRENGILQSAHVGSLTDLQAALQSKSPNIVRSFSYDINNPRQVLNHSLYRFTAYNKINANRALKADYAFQKNIRKEYDIRRAGREGIPALDLELQTHFLQLDIVKNKSSKTNKSGVNYGINLMDETNVNNPNTGIRPLIPNYESTKVGAYFINKFNYKKSEIEYALRYETKYLRALKYSFSNELNEYQYTFSLPSASIEYTNYIEKKTSLTTSALYSTRSPGVNELFSEGLHQSVASIEEGDTSLKSEESIKLNIQVDRSWGKKDLISTTVAIYTHWFNNYIQLQADDELRQTIQGAFPVYSYSQTEALITGILGKISYYNFKKLHVDASYRYMVGNDLTNNEYLAFIPNNTVRFDIKLDDLKVPISFKEENHKSFRVNAAINAETVFEQKNYPLEGIISPPPPTYTLLNANVAVPISFKNNNRLITTINIDNIFNTEYRDYLDRLRFFAALPGRNIVLNIKYQF